MVARQVQAGDVFATRLEDGRRGAIRILKVGPINEELSGDFYLTAVTTYIGESAPEVEEPRLGEILVEERFAYAGARCLNIYGGGLAKTLEYVGNVPVTSEERWLRLVVGDGDDGGFPLRGGMEDRIGYEAFYEWRWHHDRAAYEAEIGAEDDLSERRARSKPGKMMSDEEFWGVVALLDWDQAGEDDLVVEPVVATLAKMSKSKIRAFEETLSHKLFLLDTMRHAENIGEDAFIDDEAFFSVDNFVYARCVVVANGRDLFERVLTDPTRMPMDLEFEALLYVASEAYERKTGENFVHVAGCSYETFSNEAGWRTH